MNEKFVVAGEPGLKALPHWLNKMKKAGFNSYGFSDTKCLSIGYDTKPDSDWGRFTRYGRIIITKDEYFKPVCEEIRKCLGWPKEQD